MYIYIYIYMYIYTVKLDYLQMKSKNGYSSFTPCRGDHQTKVAKKFGVFKS